MATKMYAVLVLLNPLAPMHEVKTESGMAQRSAWLSFTQ